MNKTLIGVVAIILLAIATTFIFKREVVTPEKEMVPMEKESTTEGEQAPAKGTDAMESKTYTMEDVAKHSTEADCWQIIDGVVYDVSAAVSKHPGGEAILKGCGKDATAMFQGKPHSPKAEDMLKNFKLGELKK